MSVLIRHARALAAALLFCPLFCAFLAPNARCAEKLQELPALLSPILVAVPTDESVILNIVNAEAHLKGELRYREQDAEKWLSIPVDIPGNNMESLQTGSKSYTLEKLRPATRYEFELWAEGKPVENGGGSFITRRPARQPFTFAVMTDAHVSPVYPDRSNVLRLCADAVAANKPDFVLHLGDNIHTVGSGHGGYALEENHPNVFYIYFRQVLGNLQSQGAQFVLNGNWEGENGWHPQPNRAWAKNARMLFTPGPDDKTFPQGGSADQDYYAFTWGGALFVVLNVTGYNSIDHCHTTGPGKADDWTLGKKQMAWLEKTLAASKEQWKFIFTHHAVGGNGGDEVNSRYGRGGGRAANVGEQAKVHALMKKYGVEAFFYAHDHVFTDMQVDGIHYICNGSTGAPWKFTTEETGYENYIPDSGFTIVNVDADKTTVRYVTPDRLYVKGQELYKTEISAPK